MLTPDFLSLDKTKTNLYVKYMDTLVTNFLTY